jgi:hypothetical protein
MKFYWILKQWNIPENEHDPHQFLYYCPEFKLYQLIEKTQFTAEIPGEFYDRSYFFENVIGAPEFATMADALKYQDPLFTKS